MLSKVLILVGIAILIFGWNLKTTSSQLTVVGALPGVAWTADHRPVQTGASVQQYGEQELPDPKLKSQRYLVLFSGLVLTLGGVALQTVKPRV